MRYLTKLNNLLGEKPRFNLSLVEGIYRAEVKVDNKKFVGFDDVAMEAVEIAAKMAVFYIDPNNWVDDVITH